MSEMRRAVSAKFLDGDPPQRRMSDGGCDVSSDSVYNLEITLQTSGVGHATPMGWVLFDHDLVVRDCNHAATTLLSMARDEFVGRALESLPWRTEDEHGAELANDANPVRVTNRTHQSVFGTTIGLSVRGRAFRWLSVNTYPAIVDGAQIGVLASYYDVTELIQNRRNLEVALAVIRIVTFAESETEYFEALCETLHTKGRYAVVFITEGVGRATAIRYAAGMVDELNRAMAELATSTRTGSGLTGTAAQTGVVQVANTTDVPLMREWAKEMESLGLRSAIALPFSAHERRLVLNVFSSHENEFDDWTIQGLHAVTYEIEFDLSHVRSVQRLNAALTGTLRALTAMSELRDPYTAGHQRHVAALSVAIALELGEPRRVAEMIGQAAEVHDIGKMSIPAEILTRPGKLNPLEFELMRKHSATGSDIMTESGLPSPIPEVARQHHERLDGSGYPDGLRDDAIGWPARIVAVADVVEAMSHHRPYRSSLGIDEALAEVARGAGTLYDTDVVNACHRVFAAGFQFEGAPTTA